MKLIERLEYIDSLKRVQNTPDVKVITGVRRCGKSKLMEEFSLHLKNTDPKANIIHINFNLLQFEPLLEYHKLYEFIENQYLKDKNNYVLIDEIQMCPSFEKTINSLHASEKYDIYITGSNAFLLSSDLATLFTGRTFEIKVFPFSFKEYTTYFESDNLETAFDAYLMEGGMSGAYLYPSQHDKFEYINDEIFNSLIIRDIIAKYKIRNIPLLHKLIDFMMDNIGNITSIRNLANTLKSNKINTNDKTIGTYIDYLCKAFAFYRIRRYDICGKRYLTHDDKYYLADHSFRYARLGIKNLNRGRILENLVAIELLRRGYEVYVGVLHSKEIDFVAIKQHQKIYFQVADDISDEKTFLREVSPLLKIKDAYPKVLLARTRQEEYLHEGVHVCNVVSWLNSAFPAG